MNQLTTHKRKIMQFSLTKESQEILEAFSKKYGTQKSIVIDRALQFLAAKYHFTIAIHYELANTEPLTKTNYTQEEIDHMCEIAKAPWID